jgi:uncharacterized RDD family membrane protein YckC
MEPCSACGYEMTPGDKFCSNCGAGFAPAQAEVGQQGGSRVAMAGAFDGHSTAAVIDYPEPTAETGRAQPDPVPPPYASVPPPSGQYAPEPFVPPRGGAASQAAPPAAVEVGSLPVPAGSGAPQATTVCPNCGQAWTGSQACMFCSQVWGLPRGIMLSSAGRRLGGYLLDGLLIFFTLVIGWVIWTLIVWAQGQTPAKQILGMRVVRLDTRAHAGWGRMFLRDFIGKLLVSLTFGLLFIGGVIADCWLLWDKDKQELWDKIAGTVVVNDPDKLLAPSAEPA